LLRKVVEWAEVEAVKPIRNCEWNQAFWVDTGAPCGTSYCIAGYTDHISGRDSTIDNIADSAQELLGLTLAERFDLFEYHNDIDDIRIVAERIAKRAGERL
jgi:hypothetical protein